MPAIGAGHAVREYTTTTPPWWALWRSTVVGSKVVLCTCSMADEHRRAMILDDARTLVTGWRDQQAEYPDSVEGQYAAAAVRACANELEAVLDDDLDRIVLGVVGEASREVQGE